MATPPSSASAPKISYDWTTNAKDAFAKLRKTAKSLDSKKELKEVTQKKCIDILNGLSTYLDQFDSITGKSLLASNRFFELADPLDGTIGDIYKTANVVYESLFDDPVFLACFTIADKMPSEPLGKSEQQELELLEAYSLKINSNVEVEATIENCVSIFSRLKELLKPLRPILDEITFKNIYFFDNVWTVINKVKDHPSFDKTLLTRINKLAYFIKPTERSRPGSTTTSAPPSEPASATASGEPSPLPKPGPTPSRFATPKGPTPEFLRDLNRRLAELPHGTPETPPADISLLASPGSTHFGAPPASPMASQGTPIGGSPMPSSAAELQGTQPPPPELAPTAPAAELLRSLPPPPQLPPPASAAELLGSLPPPPPLPKQTFSELAPVAAAVVPAVPVHSISTDVRPIETRNHYNFSFNIPTTAAVVIGASLVAVAAIFVLRHRKGNA